MAEAAEWMERLGPPSLYWAAFRVGQGPVLSPTATADPLVVSRVRLSSPGFWEFFGGLNPFEVLRKYLNDRHERRKDREYRSEAERQRLELQNQRIAIENAVRAIKAIDRLRGLERHHLSPSESAGWYQAFAAELRAPLERLADFDRHGLIDGATAQSGPEQIEPPSE
jgi:hypothetical protein